MWLGSWMSASQRLTKPHKIYLKSLTYFLHCITVVLLNITRRLELFWEMKWWHWPGIFVPLLTLALVLCWTLWNWATLIEVKCVQWAYIIRLQVLVSITLDTLIALELQHLKALGQNLVSVQWGSQRKHVSVFPRKNVKSFYAYTFVFLICW